MGNISSIAITAGTTTSYTYDPVYRLLNVDSTDNTSDRSWTYDSVGNRLSATQNGSTQYYSYNNTGNRLDDIRILSITGPILNSYDYDDNGSRIAKRDGGGNIIETYTYDQRRLISQISRGTNTSRFAYDPNAYRISKITPTSTNNYLLEGENLEATYDENNQLKARYLRGVVVDEIINGFERDANGKLINRSYHHDQVNSVVAITDHTGATTQTNTYTPFGLSTSTGTDSNALKYTGRESDGNGVYYYRARYYDPVAGRFLSEDPIGFQSGEINHYVYVGNNPVNFNDPSGNVCVPCVTGLISGTGAAIASVASGNDFFSIETAASFGAGFAVGSGLAALGATGTVAGLITANTSATLSGAVAVSEVVVGASGAVAGDALLQGVDILGGEQSGFDFGRSGIAALGGVGGSLPSVIRAGSTLPAISNLGSRATQVFLNAAEPSIGGLALLGAAETSIGIGIDAASNFFSNVFSPSGASGGFVLYPNKINTNTLQSVYSK